MTPATVFGRERRALTLGILLAVATFAFDGMGIVPALPTAVRDLGGILLYGWAFSAFMLAWLVGTVYAGSIADARGPRLPMALGLLGFGAGLLLAASARGMTQFLAGRALQGAGGGAILAAAYVAIARGYPDALRARMMALTASVWIVPALVGPAAAGAITQWYSWRLVFAGIAPLLILIAFLVLPPLAQFDLHKQTIPLTRLVSSLRLAAGSGLILFVPNLYRQSKAAAVASVCVGVALLVPALRFLLPPGTMRARRGLPAALAVRGVLAFSFFGTEAFVPLGASTLREATPARAALALSAGALGWISASWLQDWIETLGRAAAGIGIGLARRADRVRIGFVLLAIGIGLVATTLITSLPFLLVPLGWAIAGAGVGFAYTSGGLICFAAVEPGQVGEVAGQLQIAECLSIAAGTGLGGAILAAFVEAQGSLREANAAIFTLTLAVALFGIALPGRLAVVNVSPK